MYKGFQTEYNYDSIARMSNCNSVQQPWLLLCRRCAYSNPMPQSVMTPRDDSSSSASKAGISCRQHHILLTHPSVSRCRNLRRLGEIAFKPFCRVGVSGVPSYVRIAEITEHEHSRVKFVVDTVKCSRSDADAAYSTDADADKSVADKCKSSNHHVV